MQQGNWKLGLWNHMLVCRKTQVGDDFPENGWLYDISGSADGRQGQLLAKWIDLEAEGKDKLWAIDSLNRLIPMWKVGTQSANASGDTCAHSPTHTADTLPHILTLYEAIHVRHMLPIVFASHAGFFVPPETWIPLCLIAAIGFSALQ